MIMGIMTPNAPMISALDIALYSTNLTWSFKCRRGRGVIGQFKGV